MCSAGAINDANKIDLAPWGYAPGSSIITCTDCQRTGAEDRAMFIGHKHGYRCAQHALEARQSVIRAQEGHLVPDPDQEIADAALGLIKATSDRWIRQAFVGSLLLAPAFISGIIIFMPR
jgi:hypothetical protein